MARMALRTALYTKTEACGPYRKAPRRRRPGKHPKPGSLEFISAWYSTARAAHSATYRRNYESPSTGSHTRRPYTKIDSHARCGGLARGQIPADGNSEVALNVRDAGGHSHDHTDRSTKAERANGPLTIEPPDRTGIPVLGDTASRVGGAPRGSLGTNPRSQGGW